MLSFSIDLPWITLHAIFNIQSNFHIKLGGTVKKKISTRDNEGKILQISGWDLHITLTYP